MFLVLLGERMIGGDDTWRWGLDGLGAVCILGVLIRLGQQVKSGLADANSGRAQSHKMALAFASTGFLSLVVYAFTTGWGMDLLGHDLLSGNQEEADSAEQFWVIATCFWMILWLVGTLPFVAADWVLHRNPMAVDPTATKKVVFSSLSAALLLSALFPINYWASQNEAPTDAKPAFLRKTAEIEDKI